MKKTFSKIIAIAIIAITIILSIELNLTTAEAAGNTVCYPAYGSIIVYTNCNPRSGELWDKKGTIFYNDEITILRTAGSSILYVRYPVTATGGTKEGYIRKNSVIRPGNISCRASLGVGFNFYGKATKNIYTYKHSGGPRCGSVYAGDKVYVYGSYNNYTEVEYPTSNGSKIAWIKNSEVSKIQRIR